MKRILLLVLIFISNMIFSQVDTLSKKSDFSQQNILKNLTVEGKKKLFEQKMDRVVYNVSNDVFNKGSNLMDALKRAPRVNIEQDKINSLGVIILLQNNYTQRVKL